MTTTNAATSKQAMSTPTQSRPRTTWSVIKKELSSYAGGATIYIVAIVFVALWEFMFFRNAFVVGEASVRGMFQVLPWLLLILVPALTMGSIAQEKSEGTLEFMLTHPVRDRHLLAGKFIAAVSLAALLLAFSMVVALTFVPYGNLDGGEFFAQYLASVLLAAVLVALGICISSILAGQMSALLVTAAAGFVLIMAGTEFMTARLPLVVAAVFEQVSVMTHYQSMARGVIDLRDVWYFVTIIAVFLAVAWLMLVRRRCGARKALYRRYQIGVAMLVGIAILTNLIGSRIPGRIDLTEKNRYSISAATRDVVRDLDDVVNITLYASAELPPQQQPILRDIKDTLRDYETIGNGNIRIKQRNTSASAKAKEEAQSRGVQEVQFNVIGNEQYEVKKGFLGVVVSYAGTNRAIPFVQSTNDLEYQLTSLVSELTTQKKPKVAFLAGHGEKDPSKDYPALQKELARQFEVEPLKLSGGSPAIAKDVRVLVVAGPTKQLPDGHQRAIERYLDRGGAAFLLLDRVELQLEQGQARLNKNSLVELPKRYGINVGATLVYDLKANQNASFGSSSGMNVVLPYPFFPRTSSPGAHPVTRGLNNIALPWASPVTIDDDKVAAKNLTATKLLVSSDAAGLAEEPFNINPQQQYVQDDLARRTLAVAVQGRTSGSGKERAPRLVVMGDSDMLTDGFLGQSPTNLAFGMQAISWLGQEASLASIKVRNESAERLEFPEKSTSSAIKWLNLAIAVVVPALFGMGWLWRRRRRASMSWSERRGRSGAGSRKGAA
jgi:ABC-2 type transport system permease protein